MRFSPVAQAMVAAIVASIAATLYWVLIDNISLSQAVASPFPYIMAFAAIFLGLPVYFLLHNWLGTSLLRPLILAALAISPAILYSWNYFLYPRSAFVAFLLLTTAWVGTAVFWLFARRIKF